MMLRRRFVHLLFFAFLLSATEAVAQTQQVIPGNPPAPAAASPAPAAVPPAPHNRATPPAPQIDIAEITKRADQSVGVSIEGTITAWRKQLDGVEGELRRPKLRYNELNALRTQLSAIRGSTDDFSSKLRPPLDDIKAQVEALPPVPAAGQPPEPEQAAHFRASINYHLGLLTSAKNSIESTRFRIDQLINTIQDIRRTNFTNNLFQPVPGVFSSDTWNTVPEYTADALGRIRNLLRDWWQSVSDRNEILYNAAEAVLLWLVLTVLAWRGIHRIRFWNRPAEPPFWRRASSAAGVILLRSLPVIVSVTFFYFAVSEQDLPKNVSWLLYAAARSIVIVVAVNALVTAVLAPNSRCWRLIPASDAAAVRICGLVLALAMVYGATTLTYTAMRLVQAPFSLTLALSLASNVLLALLTGAILRTPLNDKHDEGLPSLKWLSALRLPIWLSAFAIVVTAFSGYMALSRFIAQQLVVTGSILAVVYLLLLWADAVAQGMSDESSATARWLQSAAGLDQQRREQFGVPISLLVKFAILVCAIPPILIQWGYPWADILEWYRQFFFGFRIGNTQVSLAALLAAVVIFVIGYFAAKLFQSWLDAQILKPAGLSGGLRDSIRTGVGYMGVLVAALVAFSYAGFNLSNLAIVAGAFSVGIGFGLQSVVSNFVCGLILLAERPIKVGDLVVVGGEEGIVRKISVRSTEIETGDRANVLIPNSAFITEKVKNWTLRNNTGRIAISVGVAHGCNPRKVKEVLLKAAQDHLDIMSAPEPFVDFEEFGTETLNFKLYAFVYDLNKSVNIRTDLRMAILEAFNEAGILIASRQTDVTIRDMDWFREAVTQYIATQYNGRLSGNAGHLLAAPGRSEE
jgi:potassium efflux system protein